MPLEGELWRGEGEKLLGRRLEGVLRPTGELVRRATPEKSHFRQADEIACGFLRLRPPDGIQLDTESVARTRETVFKPGPTRHPRQRNLPGALAVTRPEKPCRPKMLPRDAVMTTGEYARVLTRPGASEVFVATEALATRKAESNVAGAAAAGWGGALGHA